MRDPAPKNLAETTPKSRPEGGKRLSHGDLDV
jgi:hypothetical protein